MVFKIQAESSRGSDNIDERIWLPQRRVISTKNQTLDHFREANSKK